MTPAMSMTHEVGRLHRWRDSRPVRARKRRRSHVSKRIAHEIAKIADALRDLAPPPAPLTA